VISSLVWLDSMADSSTWNICTASISHARCPPGQRKRVILQKSGYNVGGALALTRTELPSS
jgi:hypothetical protein